MKSKLVLPETQDFSISNLLVATAARFCVLSSKTANSDLESESDNEVADVSHKNVTETRKIRTFEKKFEEEF